MVQVQSRPRRRLQRAGPRTNAQVAALLAISVSHFGRPLLVLLPLLPPLSHSLEHLLALIGRGVVPPLAQLLPLIWRHILELAEVVADVVLFLRRQRPETVPPVAH